MTSPTTQPRKSLGQHWLKDQTVLRTIVDSAEISRDDTILEIGPGLGSLTSLLVEQAHQVVAVELDEKLAEKLTKQINSSKLLIISKNILNFDLNSLPVGYKVVANIPYYLTNNLLRMLCESKNSFSSCVLLVQKEVAQRITAKPGNMSLLAVSVQYYCETRLGDIVPAELFTPPPKVDSQIIKLDYRQQPLFPRIDTDIFFRIVKAGFSQRRKTILNSISAGLHLSRKDTELLLESAKISADTRAQTLSLDDWYKLYRTIKNRKI